MDVPSPSSGAPSGGSTPNPRFISQNAGGEDMLKEQTVGLVHLSDFRKRRAEALENGGSGTSTPNASDSSDKIIFKKKRKAAKKGGLSFGDEEELGDSVKSKSVQLTPSSTPGDVLSREASATPTGDEEVLPSKKKLAANGGVGFIAKSMTKSALLREAQTKEQLRREFMVMQEVVKATEFILPFVFYDGNDLPGGSCRMKKGDQVWLFLDRARKVGAERSAGGMKQWARVSVDDLMLVRGDLIIPHHYEFYYFMVNKTVGYSGMLFPHSSEPTVTTQAATPEPSLPAGLHVRDALSTIASSRDHTPLSAESDMEGFKDDPSLTKVVDRRWYEKNKHIYPASTWEDFDPTRQYSSGVRKDTQGNAYFASR